MTMTTRERESSHHHCRDSGVRESQRRARSRPASPPPTKSRSHPSSPSPRGGIFSRSRPNSPSSSAQSSKSRWSFGRKAKRSASAERGHNNNDSRETQGGRVGSGSVELGWRDLRPGTVGKWEDTGSRWEWEQQAQHQHQQHQQHQHQQHQHQQQQHQQQQQHEQSEGVSSSYTSSPNTSSSYGSSSDCQSAATTAQLAGDLCRRATALRRTLYKMPGLINQRHAFLEIIKDVASEMKLLLDAAGRLAPMLPEQQRAELDLARRKLLETSRSFSNALKGYFKEPQATPVLLAATALVYRTDEIIQALEP